MKAVEFNLRLTAEKSSNCKIVQIRAFCKVDLTHSLGAKSNG